ncbi:MAG: hypothetical protein MI748_18005 [Opitutales bacterium]|nr:hypothetical protein [Opitutales bacterium]
MKTNIHTKSFACGSLLLTFIISLFTVNALSAQTTPEFDLSAIQSQLSQTPLNDTAIEQAIADILDDEDMTAEKASRLLEALLLLSDDLDNVSRTYMLLRFNAALALAELPQDFVDQAFAAAAAAGRPFAGFLANQNVIDVPASPI